MADDVTTEEEVVTTEEVAVAEDVTTETETVETEEVVVEEEDSGEDLLDLSDEAFEKQLEEAEASEGTTAEEETTEEAPATEETTEKVKTDVAATAEDKAVKEETPGAKPSAVLDKAAAKPEAAAVATGPVAPLEVDDATAVAAYKEIFAPFRANGKTVQVKNKEEAIRLMQMGAGYTRTMMDLRPQLAQVKTLKNNGIDDAELNYLIELKAGNPDAIKKLVRTHGIDPLDIETGEAGEAADAKYRPKDYRASETQVNFEMAVADVGSHPQGREPDRCPGRPRKNVGQFERGLLLGGLSTSWNNHGEQ